MINFLNTAEEHWCDWQFAMLWQAAALIAIIWIVDVCIRKWAHPQVRYALWMLVLVKLLIPPTWTSPASVTSHIPDAAIRATQSGRSILASDQNANRAATVMERATTDAHDNAKAATGREWINTNRAATATERAESVPKGRNTIAGGSRSNSICRVL